MTQQELQAINIDNAKATASTSRTDKNKHSQIRHPKPETAAPKSQVDEKALGQYRRHKPKIAAPKSHVEENKYNLGGTGMVSIPSAEYEPFRPLQSNNPPTTTPQVFDPVRDRFNDSPLRLSGLGNDSPQRPSGLSVRSPDPFLSGMAAQNNNDIDFAENYLQTAIDNQAYIELQGREMEQVIPKTGSTTTNVDVVMEGIGDATTGKDDIEV